MPISRKKFVLIFLASGFVLRFISSLVNTPFIFKLILMGPIALPQVNFLQDDPPPPFVVIYCLIYWTILALIVYSVFGKQKRD